MRIISNVRLLFVYYLKCMNRTYVYIFIQIVRMYKFIFECSAWHLKRYVHNVAFFLLQLIILVSQFTAFISFSSLHNARAREIIKGWKSSNETRTRKMYHLTPV